MALALDATSKAVEVSSATTIALAHTCTGSDLILACFVYNFKSGGSGDPSGVTYDGVAMTKATTGTNGGNYYGQWWYLIAPAVGTHNIVATWGAAPDVRGIMAHSYTGAKQSAQPDIQGGTQSSNASAGTTKTLAVTTVLPNCIVVAACIWSGGANATPSPHTSRLSDATALYRTDTADNLQEAAGANTVTWTTVQWQFSSYVLRSMGIAPVASSPAGGFAGSLGAVGVGG